MITLKRVIIVSVLTILGFIVYVSQDNLSRSPDDFYLLPRNADDWAAWAAWLGFFATAGAVLYAALQFRSEVEEKRQLRVDRDEEALKVAAPLEARISLYPGDGNPSVEGIDLVLTNTGAKSFTAIQVKIPDVAAKVVGCSTAPIPPFEHEDFPWHGRKAPNWSQKEIPMKIDGNKQLWLFGELLPDTMVRLQFDFTEEQDWVDWEAIPEETSNEKRRNGRVAVIFTDHARHTWVQSLDGSGVIQRLWPESFIQERQPLRGRSNN